MKKILSPFLIISFSLLSTISYSQGIYTSGETAQILKSVSAKLNGIKTVSYKYKREAVYTDDNYHNMYNATVYINFNASSNNIFYHFQAEDDKYFSCYNGSQYFALNKKDKTIDIKQKPGREVFESLSPLYNSIISLKAIFHWLIKNDSIKKVIVDTVIGNKKFYLLKFELYNQYLGNLGSIADFTADYTGDKNKPYVIIIDKKTLLPYQYITKFKNRKEDFIAASFTTININPKAPAELSWFYSTYTATYKAPTPKKPLVNTGVQLEDWALPSYKIEKTDSVFLYQYKGKIVMLDFWIKSCGPCLASFPHLNELQLKFGADKFQLLSINTQDAKEDIAFFYKKHKPVYKMLFAGGQLAEQYGVSAFPTVIIIDKTGKIIYAGSFDKVEIEKLIKKNL
jgi:thiol-disulfide isomerase/thioredoxin